MDTWLEQKGLTKNKLYYQEDMKTGERIPKKHTIPTFIRNIIHHLENTANNFSDSDLKESINSMLDLIKQHNINLN